MTVVDSLPACRERRVRLFDSYPCLKSVVPHESLISRTTPIERVEGLAKAWQLPNLFVKRDDRTSDLYGGNKVRKLEWILGRALGEKRVGVATVGAIGSHHARATATFARQLGLQSTLVLFPQMVTEHVRENLLVSTEIATRVIRPRRLGWVPFSWLGGVLAARVQEGRWPMRVPAGGSSALGTLGYVEAALELAAQVAAGWMPAPDYIYVAVGTGGTAAGLALGMCLARETNAALANTEVVGICVVPRLIGNRKRITSLAHSAARLLRTAGAPVPAELALKVRVLHEFVGDGYGCPSPAGQQMIHEAYDRDGLSCEVTYTAKALVGLRAFASTSGRQERTHLYVHTFSGVSAAARLPVGETDARSIRSCR